MCSSSQGYSYAPGGSNGYFPTALPQYPGGGPGYPGLINRTRMNRTMPSPFPGPITQPGPYPTAYPQPTFAPGMPMPTAFPQPTYAPGMPTYSPGFPFPGGPTVTPAPTAVPTIAPTVTPSPTPI